MSSPRPIVKAKNQMLPPTATAAIVDTPRRPAIIVSAVCMSAIDRLLTINGPAKAKSRPVSCRHDKVSFLEVTI